MNAYSILIPSIIHYLLRKKYTPKIVNYKISGLKKTLSLNNKINFAQKMNTSPLKKRDNCK